MSAMLPRLLGLATVCYSVAVAVRPEILLKPTGLADSPDLRTTARLVALRDLASGAAMVCAGQPAALRTAVAVRVASDLADTAVLGVVLRGRPERAKAVSVTFGWGLLCGLSAIVARDNPRPSPTASR